MSISLCTWFGQIDIQRGNEQSTVSIIDHFLCENTEMIFDDVILDVCNTHNYMVLAARRRLFLFRIDDTENVRCSLIDSEIDFTAVDVVSTKTRIPSTSTLKQNVTRTKSGFFECMLTATKSTAFLIRRNEQKSTIVRLFNEPDLIDRSLIRTSIVQCPDEMEIVMASSGYDHSMFLSSSGEVYTLGTGSHGELGTGSVVRSLELVHVEALEGLQTVSIAAGGWHSVAVTATDDVYVWGWNHMGQLGSDKGSTVLEPEPLELDDPVESIDGVNNKTMIRIRKGQVIDTLILGSDDIGKPEEV